MTSRKELPPTPNDPKARVAAAIKRLHSGALSLNDATDQVRNTVEGINATLQALNIGIPVWRKRVVDTVLTHTILKL